MDIEHWRIAGQDHVWVGIQQFSLAGRAGDAIRLRTLGLTMPRLCLAVRFAQCLECLRHAVRFLGFDRGYNAAHVAMLGLLTPPPPNVARLFNRVCEPCDHDAAVCDPEIISLGVLTERLGPCVCVIAKGLKQFDRLHRRVIDLLSLGLFAHVIVPFLC
jgi:hypothetical protein